MTTSHSPLRVLTQQANRIAQDLKAAERGEPVPAIRNGDKMAIARRTQSSIEVGVIMDDKVITLDMTWDVIRETSEAGITEFILRQMRGARETAH